MCGTVAFDSAIRRATVRCSRDSSTRVVSPRAAVWSPPEEPATPAGGVADGWSPESREVLVPACAGVDAGACACVGATGAEPDATALSTSALVMRDAGPDPVIARR